MKTEKVPVGSWISTTPFTVKMPDGQWWCEVYKVCKTMEEAEACDIGMPVGPIDGRARFARSGGKLWLLTLDSNGDDLIKSGGSTCWYCY